MDLERRNIGFIAAFTLFFLTIPYDVGYIAGRSYVTSSSPSHVVYTKQGSIPGKLVRLGERGVLFVANGKPLFLKWDDIFRMEKL